LLGDRQKQLEEKIQMQRAKNKIKRLDGVCILKIFEKDALSYHRILKKTIWR